MPARFVAVISETLRNGRMASRALIILGASGVVLVALAGILEFMGRAYGAPYTASAGLAALLLAMAGAVTLVVKRLRHLRQRMDRTQSDSSRLQLALRKTNAAVVDLHAAQNNLGTQTAALAGVQKSLDERLGQFEGVLPVLRLGR